MIKQISVMGLALAVAACSSLFKDEGKTPQTKIGQLNSCMLTKVYDMKDAGTLFRSGTWTTARNILDTCEKELNISGSSINETQSMNIVSSVIESLK
ncbi:MAG: hypothetical protein II085_03855 [Alphaproteobacteria bacterium]|nr:hypothetical protein [Alphaproteobacteria bacterium]